MGASARAVVVGGGIIGLTTALALRDEGFAVTLLDQGEPGRAASWAGGGILCPLPPWQAPAAQWALVAPSLDAYPALCARLAAETGIDPEYQACGMQVQGAQDEPAALDWASAMARAVVPRDEGLWLPWVAQVRNPRLCRALLAQLLRRGVDIQPRTAITHWRAGSGRLTACSAARAYPAEVTVLAAGAWSTGLAAGIDWPLPVQPVKGQMIALQAAPGRLPHIVLREGRYLIPRHDGLVLAGSTLEQAGFDDRLDAATADALEHFAHTACPALHGAPRVAHWCGFRPGTPDGVPVIGAHPSWPGLFVNAGHFRYGLTMAPASAARLVAAVRGAAQ